MTFGKIFKQLAKRWYVIVITMLAALIVSIIFKGIFVKTEYKSSATCYVTVVYDSENGTVLTDSMLSDFLNLSKTSSILTAVAEDASIKMLGYTSDELKDSLSIYRQNNLIIIDCTMKDPLDSQLITQAYLNAGLPKVKTILTDKENATVKNKETTIATENIIDFKYTIVSFPEEGKAVDSNAFSIYVLAIIFGGFGGAFFALIPLIRGKVAYEYYDIAEQFNTQLLAVLPDKNMKQKGKTPININELITEYDAAVGAMIGAIQNNGSKTTLIIPCADNLHLGDMLGRFGSLSAQNHSTVVVDMDFRNQTFTKQCNADNLGLSEYVLGNLSAEKAEVTMENYTVIPAGKECSKAVPSLLAGQAAKLFEYLEQKFDTILAIAPSIESYRDALSLSRYAQGTILVIDAITKSKKVLAALQKIEQTDIKLLGIVMANYPKY